MSNANENPETHRLLHTREGVVSIPREQKGVPLNEYFKNADLPSDLERAVVYVTKKGPVVAKPDPVPWNETHVEKVREYAARIRSIIKDKGYYSRTLNMYASRLADQTGQPRDQMKAVIVKAFEDQHGKDPFTYLQDQRQEKGLPARERGGPEPFPGQ